MSFNANPEIKILAKISEFTVISWTGPIDLQFSTIFVLISTWILVLSRESKTIIQISSACFIKKSNLKLRPKVHFDQKSFVQVR